mmetsp:Transcript_14566/g.34096  ORF Transcript_14566/g.34096 Transcript_14566/m.34096 type:complete len:270 (-) Transcript_14566:1406-2215(-)
MPLMKRLTPTTSLSAPSSHASPLRSVVDSKLDCSSSTCSGGGGDRSTTTASSARSTLSAAPGLLPGLPGLLGAGVRAALVACNNRLPVEGERGVCMRGVCAAGTGLGVIGVGALLARAAWGVPVLNPPRYDQSKEEAGFRARVEMSSLPLPLPFIGEDVRDATAGFCTPLSATAALALRPTLVLVAHAPKTALLICALSVASCSSRFLCTSVRCWRVMRAFASRSIASESSSSASLYATSSGCGSCHASRRGSMAAEEAPPSLSSAAWW